MIDYTNNRYGNITMNGETYRLTEPAWAGNHLDEVAYFAHALHEELDEDGDKCLVQYLVRWAVSDEYREANRKYLAGDESLRDFVLDECNTCDWDNPEAVTEE